MGVDIAVYYSDPGMYPGMSVLPGILEILGQGGGYGCVLYTALIPECILGCLCYLGFSRLLDRGVWLCTVYCSDLGMYPGMSVLPGILKILGQGGMAVYCILL